MWVGFFFAALGAALIFGTTLVIFLRVVANQFLFKEAKPVLYLLAIGFLILGFSNYIMNRPINMIEYFHDNCLDQYRFSTLQGGNKETLCAQATTEYKKVMKYD